MEKIKAGHELDPLLRKVLDEHLLRHTCQFFIKGSKKLRPHGSGVLALIHGVHFIITASHVVDVMTKEEKDLYVRVGLEKYINVLGEIRYTDLDESKGIDLAYIKIDSQMVEPLSKPYTFLPTSHIRRHIAMLDAMNYCVVGFPENNIKYINGHLDTGASAYFTVPSKVKVYKHYKYDIEDWVIVEIKGKGSDIKSGKLTKINKHFWGLSGCGLWLVLYTMNNNNEISSFEYRLIGIMTEFKKDKFFCLVGNRIHIFIEALKKIEKMQFKEIPVSYDF
jgi:hypothetical protein